MPDGVDPGVDPVKPPAADPVPDRVPSHPQIQELSTGDHPVLALGESNDAGFELARPFQCAHTAHKYGFAGSLPRREWRLG